MPCAPLRAALWQLRRVAAETRSAPTQGGSLADPFQKLNGSFGNFVMTNAIIGSFSICRIVPEGAYDSIKIELKLREFMNCLCFRAYSWLTLHPSPRGECENDWSWRKN